MATKQCSCANLAGRGFLPVSQLGLGLVMDEISLVDEVEFASYHQIVLQYSKALKSMA